MMAARTSRPLWLTTLADLSLLLLGFFVFVQASEHVDRAALASGFRAGFGVRDEAAPAPMAVGLGRINGFASGSPILPFDTAPALAWARDAARDPRTVIRVTGVVDGSDIDVDALTGSRAVLAADRATAVAALLVREGIVAPDRISITTTTGRRRAVDLTLGFEGAQP
jgi:hypothetical protein